MTDTIKVDAVNVHGANFQKGDASDYVRACHRSDALTDAAKAAKGNAWELIFTILCSIFRQFREEGEDPELIHELTLGELERRIREAELSLIHSGVYNSESVKTTTHDQYMRNIRAACEQRVEFDAEDDNGNPKFASVGKFNRETKRLKDEAEKAAEIKRQERTLQRMVDKGDAANIEEARAKVEAKAAAALKGEDVGVRDETEAKVVVQTDGGPELPEDIRKMVDAFATRVAELIEACGTNDKLLGRLEATVSNIIDLDEDGIAGKKFRGFIKSSGLIEAALEDAQQQQQKDAA